MPQTPKKDMAATTPPELNTTRKGASRRLEEAFNEAGWPEKRQERKNLMAERFGISASLAQKMYDSDMVPNSLATRATVCEASGIGQAYWEYGIDSEIEDYVRCAMEHSIAAVFEAIISRGHSLNELGPGIFIQILSAVYDNAILNRDNDYKPDTAQVKKLCDLTFALKESKPETP